MSKNNENKLVPKLRFPEFSKSDAWKNIKIGDIAQVSAGGTPESTKSEYWGGEIPWMNSGELNNKRIYSVSNYITKKGYDESSTKLIPPNCVLIGLAGQGKTRGTAAINYIELCTNQSIGAIHPNQEVFESDFLYHKIDSLYDKLRKLSAGDGGRGGLNLQIIKSIEIQLPSLNEQKKIASCLSSLDEVITAESQKLEQLKDHKRGLLQNILPVSKETIPKLRFKEFQNADEWNEDTLANIASFRRGSFPQPYGLPKWYDDENGMPFIQVFDVGEDFRLKPTTKRKISSLAAEQSVFIPIGTLIITIQGSIGRVAITQYDAYIDRTLLLFEEFYQEVDITFFAYTIFLLFEIEKQKAPGGIIKTITKEVLSSFVVKLPSLEEQQKIASCLTSLDELISAQTEKVESLQLHKKGLLQGLFPNVNEVTA